MNLAQKRILWFASIVAGLVMADCWIIRKSCVREADFSIIGVGHALENNVIATFNSISLAQCKENCVDDFRCRSINHADDNSACELNDQIPELATPGDLKSKSGWTYHSTNYAVRNIGPVCRKLNPCIDLTTYCMDTCYCPGYQCVEIPNVAFKRPAKLKSVQGHHKAYRANNGFKDNRIHYCSATAKTRNSFWRVDLLQPYLVQSVYFLTSKEWGHVNPFEIRIGNSGLNGGKGNPLCLGNLTLDKGQSGTFECGNKFGRYVSVHLYPEEAAHTSYCEVQVHGMVV